VVTAGAWLYLSENEGRLPAFSVPVIDTTGAGDSFLAGFIHQLDQLGIHSLADPETAKSSNLCQCSRGTTIKPGAIAAQPTAAEVEAYTKG